MNRNNIGHSSFGHFGIAQEAAAAYGTAVAATDYTPIESESIKLTPEKVEDPSIEAGPWTKRQVEGKRSVSGSFNQNLGGVTALPILKFCERGIASATNLQCSGATAAAAAGGGLATGAHRYYVAPVYTRTGDSKKRVGSVSTEMLVNITDPDFTANLSWTNPTAPAEATLWGHAIFKTDTDGPTTTEKFLDLVAGATATTYSDTGSHSYSATAADYPDTTYRHVIQAASDEDLFSFTIERHPDTGESLQDTGCKVKSFKISMDTSNPFWKLAADVVGKDEAAIAKTVPAYVDPQYFSPFNTLTYIYTSGAAVVQSTDMQKFEIAVDNGLVEERGSTYTKTVKGLYGGKIKTTGNFTLNCNSMDEYDRLEASTKMALRVVADGPSTDITGTTEWSVTHGGNTAYAYPYEMTITIPQLLYADAPYNLSGQNRIAIGVNFVTELNATLGADHYIEIINKTATYPDT